MDFEFENNEMDQVEEAENAMFDMQSPPPYELETVKLVCKDCGEEFDLLPSEQKFYMAHGLELPKRCPVCRNTRKNVTEFTCLDCGKKFYMPASEIAFYNAKGFKLPKRCNKCRMARKARGTNGNSEVTSGT